MADDAKQVLERVASHAAAWRACSAHERARLLRACSAQLSSHAEAWVRAACANKGLSPRAQLAGEEWIAGVAVSLRALRLYTRTLEGEHQVDRLPSKVLEGKRWVRTYPLEYVDRWMMPGYRVDLQLEDDGPPQRVDWAAAPGGLGLVLGAGNIDSILVYDLLDQMLRHNRVVVVKLNPVNASMREPLRTAFRPLIEAGYLDFVQGDGSVGSALAAHPAVDAVHLTGSNATFEALVWGASEAERTQRQRDDQPRLRNVSAELGAVTPVLVVPGAWSQSDLRFQARQLAAMAAHNASCNCNAAKLVVTARHWPQREAFLQALRDALRTLPQRPDWYPETAERWQRFREAYPQAEEIAARGTSMAAKGAAEAQPWLWVQDVRLRRTELACQQEAFAPVLAETSVAAKTPEEFLTRVVDPVNEEVFGTLSCAILAPAHTAQDVLQQAIERLRYGNISVNTWPGLAFGLGQPSWGAFPGHSLRDAGSGLGHVHEPWMLAGVRRSVVRAPFRPAMRPPFDPRHRRLRSLGRAWASYEAKPSFWRLLRLAWPAKLG